MVGEPEAPVPVEDEVVRAAELVAVALLVEHVHLAGVDVDPLDPAAVPRLRRRLVGEVDPAHVLVPERAPVVRDVELSVGADRGAVRATAALGDDVL